MLHPADQTDTNEPYKDLYIYLIKGIVTVRDEEVLGEALIGTWLEDDTSFLFFSRPCRREILEFLNVNPHLELMEEHRFTYEGWHGGRFEPTRVERFLITPSWEKMHINDGAMRIIMDPGVVFGMGLHPTTRDCLRAMLYLREQTPLGSVLDLGTGTGILAVAAALLGAERVVAVDLNPLCVKTARRNVHLNGLAGVVEVQRGMAEDFVTRNSDLVIANLHYDVLKALIEMQAFREKSWTIVSGLLRSQAEEFKSRLLRYDLHTTREWIHDMTWFTLLTESRIL